MAQRAAAAAAVATKIRPPPPPASLLRRSRLEERLRDALTRRVTIVVAEAGFGKSTLLTSWAAGVHSSWYSASPEDRSLGAFARGLVDALRLRVPALPADLAGALGGSRGPDAEADELARAQACAALVSQGLQEQLRRDLALVVDDLHELGDAAGSVRLIESLCRQAPARLHLVLASRAEPPFAIDRLRGQGQVLELTGAELAFTSEDVGELLRSLLGEEDDRAAAAVHEATAGWPAAVRLAVEALRGVPPGERGAVVEGMRLPGGPLFAYLATEVFGHEPPEVETLVRAVAPLERFTPELCDALGLRDAAEILASLARRGLFVESYGRGVGWYGLSAPVREFALGHLEGDDGEAGRVHALAAEWFERHGHLEEALRSLAATGDVERTARLLREHGPALVTGGAVDAVVAAFRLLPAALRDEEIEQIAGEALHVRGDWDEALSCFDRAAAGPGPLPPRLAWRMGLIHHLRGRLDEALAVYKRAAAEEGGEPRDRALLLAWRASAHWLRGETEECRADAERAFEVAAQAGDPQALAAAHTVLAMLAALEGDRAANDAHYLRALDHAERAGDVLQLIRVRTNRGSLNAEEGAYEEAIAELDLALRLADLAGYASFRALALGNRGEARYRLGRLEEAVTDLESARRLYQRLGSRMVSYPLATLGEIYRERGDWALARAAYEEAAREAEAGGDLQGLVPALAGLARVLAPDEPAEAMRLADRAVELDPGMGQVRALLAAGWVTLACGDRARAARLGSESAAAARVRRDRAGLAESLELQALAAPKPAGEVARLEEAAALWRDLGNPLGEARAELAAGLVAPDAERAGRAEESLLALGARNYAGLIGRLVPGEGPHAVAVQALGRFRVLVHGEPVPLAAWQSRKARELLKILVARRGRPVARDYLMEALWPEQDPARVGNRLSVALSTVRAVLDPEKRFDPVRFVAADKNALWLQLEHVATDVEAFLERASEGLSLRRQESPEAPAELADAESAYSGDFLEEDAYADWALALREEARAAYVEVARALAGDAADRGDADSASRYYLRVLERDAYDEPAHLGLVAVLEAAGRHGEARRCFRAYCSRMEELGLESAPFPARGLT